MSGEQTYAGLSVEQITELLRSEPDLNRLYREQGIKVQVEFQKIHAPAPTARKVEGYGQTLCGCKGIRGPHVTCQRCLKSSGGAA